jgi:hypothetical protein
MGSEGNACKGKEYKGKSFKANAYKGKALENNAYIDKECMCSTSKVKACKVMVRHVRKRWCVMAMDVRGMHVCAHMSGQGIIGKCTLEDIE